MRKLLAILALLASPALGQVPYPILNVDINTLAELNAIVADETIAAQSDLDTFAELDALVADETLLAATSIDTSAELLAILTDETGTGAACFATSPTLVSPTINTSVALPADAVDAITEIAAALKAGSDGTLLTGTAGTAGHCGEWDANGDLVTSGAACGGAEVNDLEGDAPVAILDTEILIGTGSGSAAFSVLSGDGTLSNAGVFAISADSVALGTDTTGNYVASITDGNGMAGGDGGSEGAALTLSIDLIDDGDAQSAMTASESGLEFVSSELGLIRGCDDNEILKWDNTLGDWNCSADSTGGTPSFDSIATGTNTTATMTVGSGASIELASGGVNQSNETITEVWNDSGATLFKCTAVYVSGFNIPNDLETVAIADADNSDAMPAKGLILDDIANGAAGFVVRGGNVFSADTATGESWSVADPLYVNTSGTSADDDCGNTLTSTRPTGATTQIQKVGSVGRVHVTNGQIDISGAGRSNDVPNLEDNRLWLGNASNVATPVAISGDVASANDGVMTIQSNSVALGADTTGDFVGTITAGTGISSTGATTGEDVDHTISATLGTSITAAEMADEDHGDVSWSSGVATVEGYEATLTNSAGLLAALSDETGTGLAVFGTSPTIVTPTIASMANATHDHADAAGGGLIAQTRSMHWPAGSMEVDGTQCVAPAATALVTGGPTPLAIACADNDAATISGHTVMPDSWDASTVTFELTLGQIAASTGAYEIDFEGQCIGSDEPFLAFAGTGEQAAAITLTADDDTLQATTSAVTLNGTTCAAGDVLVWRGAVDATASAASIETLAVVVSVKMEYGITGAGD